MKIKENDKIPNAEVFILENGEPIKKNIEEFLKNKKVIIFGLPGAYTSVYVSNFNSITTLKEYFVNFK